MRLGLALRAFWKSLADREAAERIAIALDNAGQPSPAIEHQSAAVGPVPTSPIERAVKTEATQNAAVTLLAALQRDARLVDLIHEDLDQYQDAQIGAAARPCLKQCRQSLDRLLKMERVVSAEENETISIDLSESPAKIRWIGEQPAGSTVQAKLIHAGWRAVAIELPKWTGQPADADIIAPAQVSLP